MLVRGEEALKNVSLPEGLNFSQVRAALAKAEQLRPESQGLSEAQIMEKIGLPGVHPLAERMGLEQIADELKDKKMERKINLLVFLNMYIWFLCKSYKG